jgi:hypothetical protein
MSCVPFDRLSHNPLVEKSRDHGRIARSSPGEEATGFCQLLGKTILTGRHLTIGRNDQPINFLTDRSEIHL